MTPVAPPAPQDSSRPTREFRFDECDFLALRALIKRVTGINLTESKQDLVYGRLSRRLRRLGLTSFAEYRLQLESDEAELIELCNAMTTNLTAFFREAHHFDYLRDEVLKPLGAAGPRRLRIWSAACSSGEEPYSIAMTVCEAIPDWRRWDIKILATDIDSHMLAGAQRGLYPLGRLKGVGERRLREHFLERHDGATRQFQIAPALARLITFKRLNLTGELPMKGPLDVIFCRNVVIYFDKETQRDLFRRVASLQRPDDLLFLGHSESLFRISDDYALVGKTIYRRTEDAQSCANAYRGDPDEDHDRR